MESLLSNGFGLSTDWLNGTPFTDWAGPAWLSSRRWLSLSWRPPPTVPFAPAWARLAGLLAGAGLVAWILLQLLVLQRLFFLQPIIAGLGLVELVCGKARSSVQRAVDREQDQWLYRSQLTSS